ncbi:MAG TPA: hypothetical protein DCE73_08410 [Paraprevotella xylaniphila]|nr:hypothetical protein [Paraprevotella xylaniphila]
MGNKPFSPYVARIVYFQKVPLRGTNGGILPGEDCHFDTIANRYGYGAARHRTMGKVKVALLKIGNR